MRRRVVMALAAASLAAARVGFAQPPAKVWRVGFLSPRRRPVSLDTDYYGAFPRRMRELGYVEGRNLVIEWRFAEGEYGRLPAFAAELVKLNVDVILALGPPGAAAAKQATDTIPIVFVVSSDPVQAGLVRSMAKPGGNITGLSNLAGDLSSKHVEMLLAVAPKLSRVAVLLNPANPAHRAIQQNVEAAARQAGIELVVVNAKTAAEIESAFSALVRGNAGALVVALDPLFIQHGPEIAAQAARHRLPSIFANREYAEAGGLLSYGQNQVEIYRRAAGYVDRIFRGARPGDLPVEQPTKLELVVNLKTAKALGLPVPQQLQTRADKLIE